MFRKAFFTRTTASTIIAFAAGLAPNTMLAFAQDPVDEARLATVVTTAQRIEQNAQDVPVSMTMVADEKLDVLKAAGADLRFLSARVPSVIAESSFGRAFPRFYIRGFGNTDFDLNSTQPVSLVYDDVPYENPILKGYPVFDVAAVEVLRGPQGTLFGRNTPGGIIKIDSVKPSDEFNGFIKGSYATYDAAEIEAAIGGRLVENLSARAAIIHQTRDNYVSNGFTNENNVYEGYETTAGRLQFLYTPYDDFSALLNIHGLKNDGSARLFRANIIAQGGGLIDNFDRNSVFYDGGNGHPLTQESWGVNLTLKKDFGNGWDVTYIYGDENTETFSRGDIDGGFGAAFLGAGNFGPGDTLFFPSESSGAVDDLKQETHELRLAYDNGGPLTAQTGLFLFDEYVAISSLSYNTLALGQYDRIYKNLIRVAELSDVSASFSMECIKASTELPLTRIR